MTSTIFVRSSCWMDLHWVTGNHKLLHRLSVTLSSLWGGWRTLSQQSCVIVILPLHKAIAWHLHHCCGSENLAVRLLRCANRWLLVSVLCITICSTAGLSSSAQISSMWPLKMGLKCVRTPLILRGSLHLSEGLLYEETFCDVASLDGAMERSAAEVLPLFVPIFVIKFYVNIMSRCEKEFWSASFHEFQRDG